MYAQRVLIYTLQSLDWYRSSNSTGTDVNIDKSAQAFLGNVGARNAKWIFTNVVASIELRSYVLLSTRSDYTFGELI